MIHGAVVFVSILGCEVQSEDLSEGLVTVRVRRLPGSLRQDLPVPTPGDGDRCWVETADQADKCVLPSHDHTVCGVNHRPGRLLCGETF